MEQCHGGSGSGFELNGPGVVRWYYLGTAPSCWLLLKGTVLLSNAGHKTKLGEECLESSPAKRDVGVLVSSSSVWVSRVCPGTQRAKPHAGVHQAQHDQTTNRGDCPAALALGSSASVLCAVLGPTCQEGCEGPWMHPEEASKADDRDRNNILWGADENFGLV